MFNTVTFFVQNLKRLGLKTKYLKNCILKDYHKQIYLILKIFNLILNAMFNQCKKVNNIMNFNLIKFII